MLLDAINTLQDNWTDWAILFGVVFGTYFAVVWLAATYWTYKDIQARTRDTAVQVLMVLLVFVFFLPGLLLYLIIRPKLTLSERYDRNLEAEALLRELQDEPACPFCRRKINGDFLICPYCRTTLGAACTRCSKVLSFSWVVCPYCGAERAEPERQSLTDSPAPTGETSPDGARERAPRPIRQRRAPTARYTPAATPSESAAPPPVPSTDPEPAP
jgi:RNA polymerase subunit RPABC4/transcription elongation factor Spt4